MPKEIPDEKKLKILLAKIAFHEQESLRSEVNHSTKQLKSAKVVNDKIPVEELYQKWQDAVAKEQSPSTSCVNQETIAVSKQQSSKLSKN